MFKNIKIFLLVALVVNISFANDINGTETYEYEKGSYFDTEIASRVLKRSFTTISSDLINIISVPFDNPMQTLKYAGIIGGFVAVDYPLTTFYQQNIESPLDIYSLPTIGKPTAITSGSDGWLVYGSIAHYLGGFALGDEKSQITSIMAIKAMSYSYIFDHVILKSLFGRQRPKSDLKNNFDINPNHTDNPYDFNPFQPLHFQSSDGPTSMPSYHLTMYFSIAKVYQEMYDNYWLPYGALAIISISNIKGHHHWVGDMVAGGLIGTLIGHEIVSNYRTHFQSKKKSSFEIIPKANGIEFNYHF